MLTLHFLLRACGIDPGVTRSMRHRAKDRAEQVRMVRAVLAERSNFEIYASLQSEATERERVRHEAGTQYLAMFVATPNKRVMFAGLYEIRGIERYPPEIYDPITLQFARPAVRYRLAVVPSMEEFVGRLFIDWGEGDRAWVQKLDKKIVAFESQPDPPFPGFRRFRCPIADVPGLPSTWRVALESVGGVYLLTDIRNGDQYVGSASGLRGFIGRWESYAIDGHGGNVRLREKNTSPNDLQVSVLEHFGAASAHDVVQAEVHWKEMLGTRAHSLNAN